MSCFNFIIMKVNGADVSNLAYEDAVKLFLNADEPIIVEVRRKCVNEKNKLGLFNYEDDSPYKSPTLAVIASSSSASTANAPLLPQARRNVDGFSFSPPKTKPAIASISCQTDLSAFDAESKEIFFMKTDYDSRSDIFFQSEYKPTPTKMDAIMDNFDNYLKTEFDFEEITLIKSKSAENLGFTISYITDDLLASDSCSDECDDEDCIKDGGLKGKDCSLFNENGEKYASRCKIYVSDIIPNSLADQDGRLRQGDRILQINGQNVLEKVNPDILLAENKYSVKILVSRYSFGGDDDFLDSAVYCDDKECQGDKLISSNEYEYEQNTFSSSEKSSCKISKHDLDSAKQPDKTSAPITGTTNAWNTTRKILPSIASENICDIFSHANIKVQLETVSKEISLLNSQISVIKQLQTETSMPLDNSKQQQTSYSSQTKSKKKSLRYYNDNQDDCKAPKPQSIEGSPDAVEHIYETIPEDADSDVYYCSPFEGVSERRVEEWLKSIGCSNSNLNSGIIDRSRIEILPAKARLQKENNYILEDYDNSSSAYNTGGSCSSAFLAIDSSKPNMGLQNDGQKPKTLVSKPFTKTNHSSQKHENCIKSHQCSSVCRKPEILINNKCQIGTRRPQKPSKIIPFKMPSGNRDAISAAASMVAADSDGHSTLVANSSVYRMCQTGDNEEYKEKEMPGMVWKVKRRPDGSRYIVRRVVNKNLTMTEKSPVSSAIQPGSASAVDFDYKRQVYKVEERSRSKHRKIPTTPSKEKPRTQHWLV